MIQLRLHVRGAAVAAAVLGLASGAAMAQSPEPTRGRLLYETHCIACHTTQMHWRDQRRASDWASLRAWVQRWQGELRLDWNDDDLDAVARHLNETIYRFAPPPDRRG